MMALVNTQPSNPPVARFIPKGELVAVEKRSTMSANARRREAGTTHPQEEKPCSLPNEAFAGLYTLVSSGDEREISH